MIGEDDGAAAAPLAPDEATALATEVFDALAYLHANGVVHGDVKPANVLQVERRGGTEWRLADFGISSELDADLTSVPLKGLSVRWVDPDSRATGRLRPAHDVYSAALTVHVAATGGPPAASQGSPRVSDGLTGPLGSALARALGPREQRPDAATVGQLLRTAPEPAPTVDAGATVVAGSWPTPPTPPPRADPTPAAPSAPRERRRRPTRAMARRSRGLLVGVAAVVALVVLSIGGVLLLGGGDDDGETSAAGTDGTAGGTGAGSDDGGGSGADGGTLPPPGSRDCWPTPHRGASWWCETSPTARSGWWRRGWTTSPM